jgi:hypothetical protein
LTNQETNLTKLSFEIEYPILFYFVHHVLKFVKLIITQ